MGRELSLNDFLNTLAPDFRDPRIHIVLPDPDVFRDEVFSSHTPAKAEYSRKYRQSLIEWGRNEKQSANTGLMDILN